MYLHNLYTGQIHMDIPITETQENNCNKSQQKGTDVYF